MQDPKKYENNKSGAEEAVRVFLPKLFQTMKWSGSENVLDYGSGAGSAGFNYILPEVHNCDSKMYSVDVSIKMFEFAKKNYSHERITYGVGDVLDNTFPFEDVKFDKIFALHVLHFVRDIRTMLSGFHKILKPNGQFGFTTLTCNAWIFRSLKELSESENWSPYMKDYSKYFPSWLDFPKGREQQDIRELFQSSGFHVVHLEFLRDRDYQFENINTNTFLEICAACNPCSNNIPANLNQAFKEDLRKLLTGYAGIPTNSKRINFKHDYIWGVIEKGKEQDINSNL
ncbi:Juvenile hormone acid O-methyltransferase [Orchesella cincta]|uniref:phosphoethanolamine N-methyltransferase n=1 Tax=Orchesella cincta TaxID=48709 RepID=A0A1D2MPD5_ORCCI|nr:Juvenile hormone acid O-methyltransferase [Orchesella cincta]